MESPKDISCKMLRMVVFSPEGCSLSFISLTYNFYYPFAIVFSIDLYRLFIS